MYVDNFANRDPTHTQLAKYCLKQNIKCGVDGKPFIANEFMTFYCKTIPTANKMWNMQNLEAVADNCKLETKWAGLPYNVSDFIEYGGVIYQIESVMKDETSRTPQAFHFMGYNPNTYYLLVLEKALSVKDGAIPVEVDD